MGTLDNWANSKISADDDDLQRETNIVSSSRLISVEQEADRQGLYAAESLLESRIDKECDKLTAWLLRNPFDFKGDRDYVLVRRLIYIPSSCLSPLGIG